MSSIKKLYKDKKECLKYNQKIIEDYVFNGSPKECRIANINSVEIILIIMSPSGLIHCINEKNSILEFKINDITILYYNDNEMNVIIKFNDFHNYSKLFKFDKENVGYFLNDFKRLENNLQHKVDKLQSKINKVKEYLFMYRQQQNLLIKLMEKSMTLQQAVKSGKFFRPIGREDWLYMDDDNYVKFVSSNRVVHLARLFIEADYEVKEEEEKVKKDEWYHNIPKRGVFCQIWDHPNDKHIGIVEDFNEKNTGYNFYANGSWWKYARPLTEKEAMKHIHEYIYKGDKNVD